MSQNIPTKPQRILIIRNAYQKDTGGAEQYAYNLALALKRAGHIPVVVTKHKAIQDKCAAEDIKSFSGIWHETQEWGKHYYLRLLLTPLWYGWVILRHRITIVNPQSRDDFIFATRAAKWLNKRAIWTDHADLKYVMDRANRPHPRMQAWILNASQYVSKIICVSNSEQRSILKVAPEFKDKLVVVHNGAFIPDNIIPAHKDNKLIIGTNARLVPAKGISELLQAFAVVAKNRTDLQLWLLGGFSGNKEKYQREAKELGILRNTKFIGYVSHPNDYVARMDIFVHASYHEAFSLAIIEACMLGRPVVATAVGGTPEIINESIGILVPPKNPDAIAKALQKLIQSPQWRNKYGKASREYALQNFDFQKIVVNKILPLYERG